MHEENQGTEQEGGGCHGCVTAMHGRVRQSMDMYTLNQRPKAAQRSLPTCSSFNPSYHPGPAAK